jgi:hypothetical protein
MPPHTPLYSLREVQDLAKAGRIVFSPKAEEAYQEYGFSSVSVAECIAWITPDEFRSRQCYPNDPQVWWDDYVCSVRCPDGVDRTLYIKLRIRALTVQQVLVTSFHTQRLLPND